MKKIIKTLLVCMTLVLVLVAVTGCDLGTQIKQSICESKGHTMEAIAEKVATCTEDGYSSGVVCTNCGYAERISFVLEAKGHDMKDVAAKAPTCTEDGYNAHKACTRCDLTEGKEVIPATAHALTVDVPALAPTCAEDGYTAHKSCVCGETTEGKETVPATGDHKYETAVEALDPTCAEDGYTAHNVCACGAKDENYEVIPATEDHKFDENALFVGLAPTCTEKGMWAGYCLGCGKGFYVAYIDALGHTDADEDGICDVCKGSTHVNALVVGADNKIVITDALDNGAGYYITWVLFTAEEAGTYAFAGEGLTIWIFDATGTTLLCGMTGTADLEPGMYAICLAVTEKGGTGEFTATVTYTAPAAE